MSTRRFALLALVTAVAVLAGSPTASRADDTSISKDFKEATKGGKTLCKERAEFWEKKGVTGKDLYWLARLWDEGGEDDKAIPVYEQYLKLTDLPEKNSKEAAVRKIAEIYFKKRDWANVIEMAHRLRKDWPESQAKAESYDEEGRAQHMLKEKDKAIEAWKTGADFGHVGCIVDLVELYALDGKTEEVNTTLDKYVALLEQDPAKKRAVTSLQAVKGMLAGIGKPAPMEGAVAVGRGEAPADWKGKPSVLFYWHLSWGGTDSGLARLAQFEKAQGDKVRVVAVSTFNKYNPTTRKVEEGLAPEEEAKLWRAFIEQAPHGAPSICLVFPAEAKETLHLDQAGQLTVIDSEGVIRYIRAGDPTWYPWLVVEEVLNKLPGG